MPKNIENKSEEDKLETIFPSLILPPSRYTQLIKDHNGYPADQQNLIKIKILSNVTLSPIKEILELTCWRNGINGRVILGEYDNIVQESVVETTNDCVIVFWELWNLFPNAASKLETLSEIEFDNLKLKLKSELEFIVSNLKDTKLILFNRFSCIPCHRFDGYRGRFDALVDSANFALENIAANNLQVVDTNQIHNFNSLEKTLDLRYLYKAKSLYTAQFFRHYASIFCLNFLKMKGRAKKVLILDCDNTLWKGVVGEDGPENIEMATTSPIGSIFNDVQWMFKSLRAQGVLICLCTKNNDADIQDILISHSDLVIKQDDIVYISSNWRPKPENIIEISKSLNLGLDSIVFMDDSDFEIGLVREKLPQVLSLQVPKNLTDYPQFVRNLFGLFGTNRMTVEDKNRTAMYKAESGRNKLLQASNSIESYLESLEMSMFFDINQKTYLGRIAQMTQKTNQFNLTTLRMSEAEVLNYMTSEHCMVASFSLKDRYGDSGVTGASFVTFDGEHTAIIDNLLLSCRVLGRKVEQVFLNELISELSNRGVKRVLAKYRPTLKNNQVEKFYEAFGFGISGKTESDVDYELHLSTWTSKANNYISILKDSDDGK